MVMKNVWRCGGDDGVAEYSEMANLSVTESLKTLQR
jgi:hypothetical protein